MSLISDTIEAVKDEGCELKLVNGKLRLGGSPSKMLVKLVAKSKDELVELIEEVDRRERLVTNEGYQFVAEAARVFPGSTVEAGNELLDNWVKSNMPDLARKQRWSIDLILRSILIGKTQCDPVAIEMFEQYRRDSHEE